MPFADGQLWVWPRLPPGSQVHGTCSAATAASRGARMPPHLGAGLLGASPKRGRHPTRHCMDTPPPPPLPILHWQSGNSSFTSISPEWPDFEELETEWSRDAPDGRKPGLWVPLSLGGLCQVGWMPIRQRMRTCSDSAQMTWSAWVTKRRTPPCASGDGEFTAL